VTLPPVEIVLYTGAVSLIVIGLAGLVMGDNLVRLVLALAVAEAGVNLLLVLSGFRQGAVAPILLDGRVPGPMVDPIPQALVLTAIVIGVGVQALALAMVLRVWRAYGTVSMRALRARLNEDLDEAAGLPPETSREAPGVERPA
jgi:multisubunit Na+/H+ antiporter MnhC subunit